MLTICNLTPTIHYVDAENFFGTRVKLRENLILQVSEWIIGGCGLLYDREWAVLSEHRACLSQKQEPRLSLVLPFLTPHSQHLELRFQGLHLS